MGRLTLTYLPMFFIIAIVGLAFGFRAGRKNKSMSAFSGSVRGFLGSFIGANIGGILSYRIMRTSPSLVDFLNNTAPLAIVLFSVIGAILLYRLFFRIMISDKN